MRRIRIAGLCLVAVFAISIIASSTASAAAPEFGRCIKIAKGAEKKLSLYDSAKCIKTAAEDPGTEAEKLKKANYEWFPGVVKNKFTTTGGLATLATKSGKTVTCTSEKSTGEYLAGDNKHEKTTVEFAGCKSSGFACTTEGRASGELVTQPLIGEVGFEKKALKKTALKLEPSVSKGKFIEFKCIGLEIKVQGKGAEAGAGILVPIKNDSMKLTEILKYKATKAYIQKPTKWEGPNPETYLESNFENLGYEQSGQTIESKVTNEEKIELNAVL